jgi:formate hydrogenlyase subunit 3/multisubunit Na+/H+ antiporter MnhD subunit
MPASVFLALVAGLFASSAVAVLAAHRPAARLIVYGFSLAATAVLTSLALNELLGGGRPAPTLILPVGLPWLGAHFRMDALAAFFLVVVNLGAAFASVFALGYGRHESEPQRVLPFFPVFIGGMNLVVLADDAFTFLLSWELMSLASWALVVVHHREAENTRAGFIYLTMASFGTLALLLAFGVLAGADGGYGFDAIREAVREPETAAVALALVIIGTGSKAGLVPLHVWLPLAHPAAPSHVSALMSGVMTKVAVYGFVRIAFDLIGAPTWGAGLIVLTLGGITAVLGVLYALMQHDLKRLLAYHSVENIGIIFIGLGLALAFHANAMPAAAALSLTAALFHVLNHSLFKSLLFFGSGAVLTATGERDLERLGGLIHRMPLTALAFLVGCFAISALPPLNGFVSEWLTFQAILLSPDLPQWGLRIIVPAVGGLLALSAALAAACFIKAYGITFLGRPRSPAAEGAREVDCFQIAAMFILGALCFGAGILPGLVIDTLAPVTEQLVGHAMPTQSGLPWLSIVPIAESRSSYNGLLVFLFIAAAATLTALAVRGFATRVIRRGPAWDCGFPDPSPATQYTASSFAQPIRRVFGTVVFQARDSVSMPPPGSMDTARFSSIVRDPVWEAIYAPLAAAVSLVATRMNHLQFLTIRRYLSLVFLLLVGLLTILALWP